MTAIGSGSGVGGAGGSRPPERPTPAGRTSAPDKARLVTCLSQKLVDLLGARGFTLRQYGDVLLFRERGIEYLLRLEFKKGEELAAQLVIGDKSCSLFVYEKNMTEAEEAKLVENLKEILIGDVKKSTSHYNWTESGLIPLLDKYQSEVQALAAKPIPNLDGPWPRPTAIPRPVTTRGSEKIPMAKPTLIRLTSDSLAQVLNKYLNPHGFTASAAKDEFLRNYPKVIISKGKEKLATLSINNDLAWLSTLESGKDIKTLVEILNKILGGKARQHLDKNVYWYDAKIDAMTQKLQPDLKALSETPKIDTAVPVKENGVRAGLADTLPQPVPVPSHEMPTKPIEYPSALIQGKGKDAKLLFTGEQLAQILITPVPGKLQVVAVPSQSPAQAVVEITVNAVTYRLTITPLIATLHSENPEANYSITKILDFIFGRFNPRPGKRLYICTINWPRVEAFFAAKMKAATAREAESSAAAEKIALETTAPNPLVEVSASPTAETAAIKTEFEEAVKKWAQSQLVEWLRAKFREFKLDEMAFSFSEGRVNISVKAAHQIFVKKEVDSRGVTNRILNFSLSVGEFGTFVRQIIPDHRDLRLLQEALVNLGKSKQSYVSLHYPNLDIERFSALIGYHQEGGESR